MNRKSKNFWNKTKCLEEAKKFNSRSEFKKSSGGAYNSAKNNKWLEEACSHMKPQGNRFKRLVYVYIFSDKHVYVGLTYNLDQRKSEHQRKSDSQVYQHVEKNPNLEFAIKHTDLMPVNDARKKEAELISEYKSKGYHILNIARAGAIGGGYLKWDYESCKKEALKYSYKKTFANKSGGAYNSARKNGWIEEICSHMETKTKHPMGYWNLKKASKEALKYDNKVEFFKKSRGAYMFLQRNGQLNKACPHMNTKKPNGYWTKEKCFEELGKYGSKKELMIKNNSVYVKMCKNKWI